MNCRSPARGDLRYEYLSFPLARAREVIERTGNWIPAPVPGDIHQACVAVGWFGEPLVGLQSYDCRWTEERSWWYRKTFVPPEGWESADVVELSADGLDSNAEIFLNGAHVGSHRSAFYPFVTDVKPYLVSGDNVLLIRLTVGIETVSDYDVDDPDGTHGSTEEGNGKPDRGDLRRVLVRKPQYVFGWDWGPRLATTAIGGDVTIRAMREACIRDVTLVPPAGGGRLRHRARDGGRRAIPLLPERRGATSRSRSPTRRESRIARRGKRFSVRA